MSGHDKGVEWLKASVSCAVLLERWPPVWRLDRAESSRASLKYRRGEAEILIVNHDGHGWWDPLSDAKGDIFDLARHLEPGLTFPEACCGLRAFAGIAPAYPEMLRTRRIRAASLSAAEMWGKCPPLSPGSQAWRYLSGQRGLPESVLLAARAADAVRNGPGGSAWFAHRDAAGCLTGIEMRGPNFRKFSAGGAKTLFRLPGGPDPLPRAVICESAIDALSLVATEHVRPDTLYAATAGGMGPATIAALQHLLHDLSGYPGARLTAATDADIAGRRHATRLEILAIEAGVAFERLLPPDGLNDWNDALRAMTPRP